MTGIRIGLHVILFTTEMDNWEVLFFLMYLHQFWWGHTNNLRPMEVWDQFSFAKLTLKDCVFMRNDNDMIRQLPTISGQKRILLLEPKSHRISWEITFDWSPHCHPFVRLNKAMTLSPVRFLFYHEHSHLTPSSGLSARRTAATMGKSIHYGKVPTEKS